MRTGRTAPGTALIASLGLAVLGGCASGGSEVVPPVEPPPAFSSTGADEVPARWWTAFEDPVLDRLVAEALGSNLDLATAWHRLREARAIADREASDLFPDADGFFEAAVERPESPEGPTESTERLRLGLAASYEVDLWGGIRSRVEAERLRASATLTDYRTAALSLSAEVARTWFQLVEARGQLAVLAEQLETNETIARLLENRFGSGQIRGVDVLRQRQLAEATRELILVARARYEVLEHLLAVLLGRPLQTPLPAAEAAAGGLPALPPLPATGLPAELVRRRPDVESAFRRLQAADHEVAAAIAARYPRLSLGASVVSEGEHAADLFDDWVRSLAGSLLAPLFRAGELKAEVDRTEAVRAQALAFYGQATLIAFQEVEDALVLEAQERRRIESLESQLRLAEQAYEQLRTQYFHGLNDYIDVLTALTEAQRLRRDLLASKRVLLEQRIALYRALAGGFETPREMEAGRSR